MPISNQIRVCVIKLAPNTKRIVAVGMISVALSIAPGSYLEAGYKLGDFAEDGWNGLIAYEALAETLVESDIVAAKMLIAATEPANSWNKPIAAAIQFWKDYIEFQWAKHPDIPAFVNTHRGSRAGGVWPSFYDDELRNNRAQPDRKRIQIVHMDTNGYVSLFVKRVSYPSFVTAI